MEQKRLCIGLAILIALIGCSPKVLPPTQQVDSVRVEVRERLVHDTINLVIEREVEKNVTSDTVSYLENTYAKSNAKVTNGLLTHTLETKEQKKPVPVVVTVKDTVIVEKQAETKYVSVPAEFSPMQHFFLVLGKILGSVLVLFIVGVIISLVIKFKKI